MELKEKIMQVLEIVENGKTGISTVDKYHAIPIILLKIKIEEKIGFAEMKVAINQLKDEKRVLFLKNDDVARDSAIMTYGVDKDAVTEDMLFAFSYLKKV